MSLRAMGQASVTMNNLQKQIDTISHNLANLQTPGYKQRQAEFSALLTQHIANMTHPENARGRMTPDGIRLGTGARLGVINNKLVIGSMQRTDRSLDAALKNEHHFFQVSVIENGEEQIRYTRDGSFYVQPVNDGAQLVLVTKDGHPVQGVNGPIQFDANNIDDIFIGDGGEITVRRGDVQEIVGQLAIVEIERSRILQSTGDNFFQLPDLEALGLNMADIVQNVPVGDAVLDSGVLEMSNVRMEEQMTQLMNAQRSYQFNSRTISMMDQMQVLINQVR